MKTIVPSYYKKFACTADACHHNCCIGWEIDIDKSTYDRYLSVHGEFGERLRNGITSSDGQACFLLGNDERCPFLNKNNLCDIIINLGKDNLCEICAEHPRFRNYYTSRIEIGLGLSCESAAKLILGSNDKFELTVLCDDSDEQLLKEEEAFFTDRQQVFDIIQDRTHTITERIIKLVEQFNLYIPDYTLSQWSEIFLDFEQLDTAWSEYLLQIKNTDTSDIGCDDIIAEQLLTYFVYRHFSGAIDDGRFEERLSFAIVSLYIICTVATACKIDIVEAARLYSAEIEYSCENTEKLFELLGR